MKTFSDIKRRLIEGATLTMTRHDYGRCQTIGVPRRIVKRQSNAIQFEGGSWLRLDRPASEYIPEGEDGFLVRLHDDKFIQYRFN